MTFSLALPVAAQDVQWNLVDTGVAMHSVHGRGAEMRIQPIPVPEGLFQDERLDGLMHGLCNHFAPLVIPHLKKNMDIETFDFISVRIVSGGVFGRFVLTAYEITEDGCGDPLLAYDPQ
ncbi:hypothetical protein [Aestuariibius sp. HNIBRBA575]|uniref:hypothetical protein n=1 Tax=Aestuariibius sp. HNIBRBA575 TaxID=3233343 RepID=UPI0034A18B6C